MPYNIFSILILNSFLDLKKATRRIDKLRMDYGVYALYLKNGVNSPRIHPQTAPLTPP